MLQDLEKEMENVFCVISYLMAVLTALIQSAAYVMLISIVRLNLIHKETVFVRMVFLKKRLFVLIVCLKYLAAFLALLIIKYLFANSVMVIKIGC